MNPTFPPHLALGCFSREVIEILKIESRRLEIDAIDILLITCVAYLSTANALSDPMSIEEYEGGNRPLPLEYCRGVLVKEVAITLNMNRETVRRRMSNLQQRNFFKKSGRFYFMAYQSGDHDFTSNTRTLVSRALLRIKKDLQFS
jgi:hypothetical protein